MAEIQETFLLFGIIHDLHQDFIGDCPGEGTGSCQDNILHAAAFQDLLQLIRHKVVSDAPGRFTPVVSGFGFVHIAQETGFQRLQEVILPESETVDHLLSAVQAPLDPAVGTVFIQDELVFLEWIGQVRQGTETA